MPWQQFGNIFWISLNLVYYFVIQILLRSSVLLNVRNHLLLDIHYCFYMEATCDCNLVFNIKLVLFTFYLLSSIFDWFVLYGTIDLLIKSCLYLNRDLVFIKMFQCTNYCCLNLPITARLFDHSSLVKCSLYWWAHKWKWWVAGRMASYDYLSGRNVLV